MVSSWIGTRSIGGGENYGRRGEHGYFSMEKDTFIDG